MLFVLTVGVISSHIIVAILWQMVSFIADYMDTDVTVIATLVTTYSIHVLSLNTSANGHLLHPASFFQSGNGVN